MYNNIYTITQAGKNYAPSLKLLFNKLRKTITSTIFKIKIATPPTDEHPWSSSGEVTRTPLRQL